MSDNTLSETFRILIFTTLIIVQIRNFNTHQKNTVNQEISHQISRLTNIVSKLNKIEQQFVKPANPEKLYPNPTILFWDAPYRGFNCLFKPLCGGEYNCDCRVGWWNDGGEPLKKSDAVVISAVGNSKLEEEFDDKNPEKSVKLAKFKKTIKESRKEHQLYVFFQSESPGMPIHQHDYHSFDNFFNATLSYRLDSDYKVPYGSIGYLEKQHDWKLKNPEIIDFNIKNHGVLSVISNCASTYRNDLVKKLDSLIILPNGDNGLSVYGHCSKLLSSNPKSSEIPRGSGITELSKNYKFYLAFENSKCKDYITEKFFVNGIKNGLVPIVSGADRKDYEQFVPGSAFMHVDDFGSIEELAEQVNYFLKNSTAYSEFFDWRRQDFGEKGLFVDKVGQVSNEWGWCKLCKDLNVIRSGEFQRLPVVQELHDFWYGVDGDLVCEV